jgi:hypothetical protein
MEGEFEVNEGCGCHKVGLQFESRLGTWGGAEDGVVLSSAIAISKT